MTNMLGGTAIWFSAARHGTCLGPGKTLNTTTSVLMIQVIFYNNLACEFLAPLHMRMSRARPLLFASDVPVTLPTGACVRSVRGVLHVHDFFCDVFFCDSALASAGVAVSRREDVLRPSTPSFSNR